MRSYAVMMDPTMIQNILKTDTREARDLLSWSMIGAVVGWSTLPIAFLWWVRIEHRPLLRSLFTRAAAVAGALVIAVLSVLLVSRDITSLMRNQRELRYLITPGNFIYGLAGTSRVEHTTRARRASPWVPTRG